MLSISQADTAEDLDAVRSLMRSFIEWHRVRHAEDIELVDKYFDGKAYEDELAGLPGKFAPPRGSLLLAIVDSNPAGCVALREVDSDTCEMKRLFVYEKYHGFGVGKALAKTLIDRAKAIGYRRMVLDTGARQIEAQTLYHRLGFRDIEPYYDLPEDVAKWLQFMALDL
jgi:GNAT superfamily N-acetyltransferase